MIWAEKCDPETSIIYALNDFDAKLMKIRIIIAATCAALAFEVAGIIPTGIQDEFQNVNRER